MAACPDRRRRARREPRPADRRGLAGAGEARGRARDVRPLGEREDPGLPQGEDPEARPRLAPRQGADLRRGGGQPHRRLVLERGLAQPDPPRRGAAVRVRAPGERGRRLELRRDGRRAAASGARRLDDARGRARRGRGAAGGDRRRDRGAARVRRGARARRTAARRGRATRSSSTSSTPTARLSATPSSSWARDG